MRTSVLVAALAATASASMPAAKIKHSSGQCLTKPPGGVTIAALGDCDSAASFTLVTAKTILGEDYVEIVAEDGECLSLKNGCEASWRQCPDNEHEYHGRTMFRFEGGHLQNKFRDVQLDKDFSDTKHNRMPGFAVNCLTVSEGRPKLDGAGAGMIIGTRCDEQDMEEEQWTLVE